MIHVVKVQSFIRTPHISLLMEGENWLVGFDEIFDEMPEGALLDVDSFRDFPASRIVAINPYFYRIELPLDGFSGQSPRIEVKDGFLVVTGTKTEYADKENRNYFQRGINARGFRRSYQLRSGDRVLGTNLHKGILQIDIEQAVPSEIPGIKEPVANWVRAG